jgi:transcriptional regulator with XRE-family HTH domain
MITIADRLVEAMKKANISQADLHRKTGFTRAAISKWVNGHSEPKDILTLSRILDVTPEWLQTGKESRARGEQYNYENLTEEQLQMKALASMILPITTPNSNRDLQRIINALDSGVLSAEKINELSMLLKIIADRFIPEEIK